MDASAAAEEEEEFHDAEGDATPAGWRADAVAAADEAFTLLLACESADGWARAGVEQGIEVLTVPYGHASTKQAYWVGKGFAMFRAACDYPDDAPADVFAVLHDWQTRPSWDTTAQRMETLMPLRDATPARTDAIAQHLTRPMYGGLVGPREFCYVASTRHEALGTPSELHLSICRWHPGGAAACAPAPPVGFVRGHLFFGGVSLRRAPGGGTRVVLTICANPNGAIPRAAVNLGGVRGAGLLADLRRRLRDGA